MPAMKETSDATFQADVLTSERPVLVDFWAVWCNPCKKVGPILEEIAADSGDRMSFYKLNTDENPATTAKYGITSIPTINVYVGGELVKSIMGAHPKPKLLRELEEFLG